MNFFVDDSVSRLFYNGMYQNRLQISILSRVKICPKLLSFIKKMSSYGNCWLLTLSDFRSRSVCKTFLFTTTCNKRSCRMQISALSHQAMPEVIDLYWITSFGSGHNLVYHHQSFNLMLNDFCWRSCLPSVWVPNIAKSNLATYNYSYQFLFFIPRILYS